MNARRSGQWVSGITAAALAVALALGGCGRFSPVPRPVMPDKLVPPLPPGPPTGLPSAIRTTLPGATNTPAPDPAGSATAIAAASSTAANTSGHPTPSPTAAGSSSTNPTGVASTSGAAASFHDCARTPGLVGCDPRARPVAAWLAFAEPDAGRIVGLDLEDGAGWQAPVRANTLDWTTGDPGAGPPQQPRRLPLLVARAVQSDLNTPAQVMLFDPQGRPAGVYPADELPGWLANPPAFDENGAEARLDSTPDGRWTLHVHPETGAEQAIPLESEPSDRLYNLVGWAPGTALVLAQQYTAGNAAMLQGGTWVVIDTATGQVTRRPEHAPLFGRPAWAWNPVQKGLLAFVQSGSEEQPGGGRQLAIWNLLTGQVRYPLPEGVQVGGLAWRPDGERLAVALRLLPAASNDTRQALRDGAIHLLDPLTGTIDPLTAPPPGGVDDWPNWAPDGQALVYARGTSPAGSLPTAEIRLREGGSPENSASDAVLVQGLGGLVANGQANPWWLGLAYQPR